MAQSFVIIKKSWLTNTGGNEHRIGEITEHIYQVAKFLQKNCLTKTTLMKNIKDITDDFQISSDDLTEEGMTVMRLAYDKWLTKVDNGMHASDVSILEKALTKIRQGEA